MSMSRLGTVSVAAALCFAGWQISASAGESTEELALGGITIAKPADAQIAFESADIVINPSSVTAKYKIINQGPAPANVTLGFAMPDLDFSDPDASFAIPGSDPVNFVGLSTKIDGKPGGFAFTQSAQLNGKDITASLRQNKLALVPVGTFQNQLAALAPELRDKLAETGVIMQAGNDAQGNALYFPAWSVRTTSGKRITLAPGQSAGVEISYRTSVGMSLDTPLRNPLRGERNLAAQVQLRRTDYCIDDAFYTGLDKIAALGEANTGKLRERRMVFVLQGRNPTGPIKDFRLVVDKGRPDRVVSFCLENLKKISPTAFEMRAADFAPAHDLKVIMIGRN